MRPNAAEGLGIVAPVAKSVAETTGEELELIRVGWSKREGTGWPEFVRAGLAAAAGVRASNESTVQSMAGAAVRCVGLVGVRGVR